MTPQVQFYILGGALLVSAAGYGVAVARRCLPGSPYGMAFAASLGIAVMIFLGGVINAAGLAGRTVLDIVLVAGIALFAIDVTARAAGRAWLLMRLRAAALDPASWLALAVLVFCAARLVPTAVFNPHDDLVQYLFRPYHMFATGSLANNWFDSTGADSFGAQSWMQAFLLNRLPFGYVEGFDRVICLGLACGLLADLGRLIGAARIARVVAIVVLLAIPPSAVNISALYSLSMVVLGLLAAILLFARSYFAPAARTRDWVPALLPVAVFAATLPALKFTTLILLAAMVAMFVAASLLAFRSRRDVAIASAAAGVAGLVVLGPWVAAFLPLYLEAAGQPRGSPAGAGVYQALYYWALVHGRHWFEYDPVQYGQRGLVTTLAMLLAMAAPWLVSRARSSPGACPPDAYALAIVGPAAALSYFVSPALFPWGHLRYTAPQLIAVLPAAGLFVLGALRPRSTSSGVAALAAGLVLVAFGAALVLNAPDTKARLALALKGRTTLVIASDPDLRSRIARLMDQTEVARIRAIQDRVPPGETILAMTVAPIHLDQRRNPVDAVFMAAMSSPWWGELADASPQQIREMLVARGVDYVLWQRAGPWVIAPESVEGEVRHPIFGRQSRNYLAVYRAFESLRIGPVLYANDEFVLFRVVPGFSGRGALHTYGLGATSDFALGRDFNYGVAGWAPREASGMWSVDRTASLRFLLDPLPPGDVVLRADFMPYVVPPAYGTTTIDVQVNGTPAGRWVASEMASITRCVHIPRGLLKGAELDVTFVIDGPPPPVEMGVNSDTRRLGMLLERVRIDPAGTPEAACPH